MATKTVTRLEEISGEIVKNLDGIITPLMLVSENLYLVGGYLYRNLAQRLYGTNLPKNCDIDFVARGVDFKKLPKHWVINEHKPDALPEECSGFNITTEGFAFDLVLFKHHASSVLMKAEPSIETYLKFVPLSIQSIAWDFTNKCLIGDIGIKSLIEKKVWFNNKTIPLFSLREKEYWTRKISDKAKELGFVVDLER